ncbi:hypothetical protein TTHERM_000401869 (macronuclear) [Tetrahymena thermophila SB210]|uniref:Uncharacterized protein n=1 Tax=Tetrahymena thermophila (strain SB210) TaxID=312017 RepID=W7XDP4_TETTS|nr:hypothetical protein TTHERM_000401869 [Tetrahymena thermophila SB210]EWS74783.1 hypothetical protein TTHERM_000401869 [Tetrahymena thermophila SB210]|eukprot:XP_012652676.1 hypothetical protein TTHERM_000401869 [Tetrahymena thermophila SB210]
MKCLLYMTDLQYQFLIPAQRMRVKQIDSPTSFLKQKKTSIAKSYYTSAKYIQLTHIPRLSKIFHVSRPTLFPYIQILFNQKVYRLSETHTAEEHKKKKEKNKQHQIKIKIKKQKIKKLNRKQIHKINKLMSKKNTNNQLKLTYKIHKYKQLNKLKEQSKIKQLINEIHK